MLRIDHQRFRVHELGFVLIALLQSLFLQQVSASPCTLLMLTEPGTYTPQHGQTRDYPFASMAVCIVL